MDEYLHARISKLLREAAEAADPKSNGLMDREAFPVLIRKLQLTVEYLLAESDGRDLRQQPASKRPAPSALGSLEPTIPSFFADQQENQSASSRRELSAANEQAAH